LGDIGITQTGTTPSTSKKEYYGDFIPFIKPADIDIFGDGVIRYDNEGLSEEGANVGRIMKEGSVLMVCIGATIGKVGFVNRDVSCNQQINSLTVKKDFEPKLFCYAMRTKEFYHQVIRNSSQATLPIINKSKWENLLVHYPKAIAEQRAIVTKLDALSEQTKKLEAIYQQKLADLEELKKSVLRRAFAGEL
jgi:type I restriction enzyme S subunit